MSGLGQRLVSEMAGYEITEQPTTFREKADALLKSAGTLTAAAKIAGVDRRTYQRWYQRWREGKEPKIRPGTLDKVNFGVRRSWTAREVGDRGWSLTVNDRNEVRTREISMEQLKLAAGTMARVAEVYRATGDQEAAAAAFLAGVQDRFYRRWLTPPATDREGTGTGAAGAGPAVQLAPAGDVDEFDYPEDDEGEEIPETAWDEFMDAIYEASEVETTVPDDDGYGGDVA